MKKYCYGILGLMTVMLLISGCGKTEQAKEESTKEETELEEVYLTAEEDEPVPTVEEIFSESIPYQQLAEFLIAYYQIPKEYQAETRYYYNYVDLNDDGLMEVFAVVIGEYTEVSSGNPAVILSVDAAGEFVVVEAFPSVQTPITISEQTTNGWHDIIYYSYGRDEEDGYRICRYDPEGGYQTALSEIVDELEPVGGIQILSNNLIDDMDRGCYLTLAPKTENVAQ